MPSMANIVVKKNDGTTDVTYTAVCPSSGDSTAAVWRSETAGASASLKPTLTMITKLNGPKTARQVELNFAFPWGVTDSTTGITTVKNKVPFKVFGALPLEIPDTVIAEAVAQCLNLVASTLVRDSIKSGYSPS